MIKTLLRIAISVACFGLLFATLADMREVGQSLRSIGAAPLLLAFLLVVADRCLMSYKWLLLLRSVGCRFPLLRGTQVYCTATLLGMVLPITVGSDVLRGVWMARCGVDGERVAASILVERLVGFLCVLLLGLVSACFLLTRSELDGRVQWLIVIILGVFASALGVIFLLANHRTSTWLVGLLPEKIRSGKPLQRVMGVLAACHELGAARSTMVGFAALTFFEQLLFVSIVITLAMGLGLTVSPVWIFCGVTLSLIISRLPISIDGLGVFEAIFASIMALAGVPGAASVAIAILGRLLQVAACAPWALAFFWSRPYLVSAKVPAKVPQS